MIAPGRPGLTIEAFEAGNVDASAFDHAAHVHVGWLYLRRYPLALAIERFTDALQRLTRQLGAADKYHETITCFFLLLIAERRAEAPAESWAAFRARNADLFSAGPLLRRYYLQQTLNSERARRSFVLPDRLAA